MKFAVIHSQGPFSVESYGNGLSYSLVMFRPPAEPLSVHFQGIDATNFREELERVYEAANDPAGHVARKGALAWLWDECGYGELAE